jgi:RNA polymerase sigma-70 factor (ECF subfamily)
VVRAKHAQRANCQEVETEAKKRSANVFLTAQQEIETIAAAEDFRHRLSVITKSACSTLPNRAPVDHLEGENAELARNLGDSDNTFREGFCNPASREDPKDPLPIAWEELKDPLINRYCNIVHRTAFWILGNQHDAEDMAVEVIRVALEKLPPGLMPYQVEKWLRTTTTRECWRRAEKRIREGSEGEENPFDPGESCLQQLGQIRPELVRAVMEQGLLRLPEKQQLALVLRVVEERGYPEIAEILGVTEGRARQLVHYAMEGMRLYIEEMEDRLDWRFAQRGSQELGLEEDADV